MASTVKQVIEQLSKLDPDQMLVWQYYTQDDFEIGDNFYVSKETWNEFAKSEPFANWWCVMEDLEEQLNGFMIQKQEQCEHAEVKHVGSSAHLGYCVACQFEFDCECKEWQG